MLIGVVLLFLAGWLFLSDRFARHVFADLK